MTWPGDRAPRGRIDYGAIKDRIPIEAVVIEYAGPPAKTEGGRQWFHCPMPDHEDRNPSFSVDPASGRWTCWSRCGSGDAIDLVRRLEGASFPEAKQRLAAMFGFDGGSGLQTPAASMPQAPPRPEPAPPDLEPELRQEGEALVAEAEKRLWGPKGGEALAHLRGRGLPDEAIHIARLGVIGSTPVPYKNRPGRYTTAGITIPWIGPDGRLDLLKIRRPAGSDPKYHATYWGGPSLYAPFGLRLGFPLIVVEGEFDAILLGWELKNHADVATVGSASNKPSRRALQVARGAPALYLAHDADEAGDRAASLWPSRAIRVRPPAPLKDWGELHQADPAETGRIWSPILRPEGPDTETTAKPEAAERAEPEPGEHPRPEDFATLPPVTAEDLAEAEREAREERLAIMRADGIEGEPETGMSPGRRLAELNRLMGRENPPGLLDAIEEMEAQAEHVERIGPSLPQGGFQPEEDDEAARLALFAEDRPEPVKQAAPEPPDFLADRLTLGASESSSEAEVFNAWVAWSRMMSLDPQDEMKGFSAALSATLARRRLNARLDPLERRWIGLGLKPEPVKRSEGGNDLEAFDRLLGAAGFRRVDPSELDALVEFDPPAVDRPAPIGAEEKPNPKPRRSVGAAEEPLLF